MSENLGNKTNKATLYTYEVFGAFGLPRKTFGEEDAVAIYVPRFYKEREVEVTMRKRSATEQQEQTGIDRNKFILKQGRSYNIELLEDVLEPEEDRIYIHTFEPIDFTKANAREVLDRQRIFIQANESRANEFGEEDPDGQYEGIQLAELETRNDAKTFKIQFWRNFIPMSSALNKYSLLAYPFLFQTIYGKDSDSQNVSNDIIIDTGTASTRQARVLPYRAKPVSLTKDRVEWYDPQLDPSYQLQFSGFEKFFTNDGANLKEYLTIDIPQEELSIANNLYERLLNILVLQANFNNKFVGAERDANTGKMTKINGQTKLGALSVAGINEQDNLGENNGLITSLPLDIPNVLLTQVYKRFIAMIKGLSEYIQTDYAEGQGLNPSVRAEQLFTIELITQIATTTPIDSGTTIKARFKSSIIDISNNKLNGLAKQLRNISSTPTIIIDQPYQFRKLPSPINEEDLVTIGKTTTQQKPLTFFYPIDKDSGAETLYKVPTDAVKISKGEKIEGIGFSTGWLSDSELSGSTPAIPYIWENDFIKTFGSETANVENVKNYLQKNIVPSNFSISTSNNTYEIQFRIESKTTTLPIIEINLDPALSGGAWRPYSLDTGQSISGNKRRATRDRTEKRVVGTYSITALQDTTQNYVPLQKQLLDTTQLISRIRGTNGGKEIKLQLSINSFISKLSELEFVGTVGLNKFRLEVIGETPDKQKFTYETEEIVPPSAYDETISSFKVSFN